MPLTELECKRATCPPDRAQVRLTDERGMYLEVTRAGGKYWRLKYRFDGKEKRLALGVYPEITLAQARRARDAAREEVARGQDPSAMKRMARTQAPAEQGNTFEQVARLWWDHWRSTKTDRHAGYVIRRLEADVFPSIGAVPVQAVTTPALVQILKSVEARDALDIAKRLLQTCAQVFRYAIAHGYATRNPAADIRPSDVLRPRRKKHYARLETKEVPELLMKIEAYQGTPTTRLAMKLMALTFVRTSELIGARWEEFDLQAAEWRIPAERMKMRTPHIVPLSRQALDVLRVLQTLSGTRALLFTGERDHDRPMSNNTILGALDRMGYAGRMTGHGFRGIASTILHELGYPHHVIELQLAHTERDEVSAAYNHATYLTERRNLMQQWADHLDALRTGSNVIPIRRQA